MSDSGVRYCSAQCSRMVTEGCKYCWQHKYLESFSVSTFNILDPFLSRRTIPKNMTLDIQQALKAYKVENTNVFQMISDEYGSKFHIGIVPQSGIPDKYFKREELWDTDIQTERAFTELINGRDLTHLRFESANEFSYVEDGKTTVLHSLPYYLENHCPENPTFLQNIKASDTIGWANRGFDVLQKIRKLGSDVIFLQEYGQVHNLIIPQENKTLVQALDREYAFTFFLHPFFEQKHAEKNSVEGILILYKRIKFRPFSETVIDTRSTYRTYPHCLDIDRLNPGKDMADKINHKWAGVLKLTLSDIGKHVVFINTHFVTDSRDKVEGKNKRFEFQEIVHYLQSSIVNGHISQDDAIVFGGDLNTEYWGDGKAKAKAYTDRQIFGADFVGIIPLDREGRTLRDSYLSRTMLRTDYTSKNAEKRRIIDYIFHSENLRCTSIQIVQPMNDRDLPNVENPSDHLPVTASFQLQCTPPPPSALRQTRGSAHKEGHE